MFFFSVPYKSHNFTQAVLFFLKNLDETLLLRSYLDRIDV